MRRPQERRKHPRCPREAYFFIRICPRYSRNYLHFAITIRNRQKPERRMNASISAAFSYRPQDYSERKCLKRIQSSGAQKKLNWLRPSCSSTSTWSDGASLSRNTSCLARKFHHEGRKVAKSFRQPVTIESLTQEVTGDFANDGL